MDAQLSDDDQRSTACGLRLWALALALPSQPSKAQLARTGNGTATVAYIPLHHGLAQEISSSGGGAAIGSGHALGGLPVSEGGESRNHARGFGVGMQMAGSRRAFGRAR